MGRPEGPHCYCAANTHAAHDRRPHRRQLRLGRHGQRGRTRAHLAADHARRRPAARRDRPDHARGDGRRSRGRARRRARHARQPPPVSWSTASWTACRAGSPGRSRRPVSSSPRRSPADPLVNDFDATGRPLVELPDDDPTVAAVRDLVDALVPQAPRRKEASGADHRREHPDPLARREGGHRGAATRRPSRRRRGARWRPAPGSSTSTSARRRSAAPRSCRGSSRPSRQVTDVPLSLDTTNLAAMEAGLQVCQAAGDAQLGLGRP